MSRDCCVALSRGAMGLSAVCDCNISRSYLILFWGVINANSYGSDDSANLNLT